MQAKNFSLNPFIRFYSVCLRVCVRLPVVVWGGYVWVLCVDAFKLCDLYFCHLFVLLFVAYEGQWEQSSNQDCTNIKVMMSGQSSNAATTCLNISLCLEMFFFTECSLTLKILTYTCAWVFFYSSSVRCKIIIFYSNSVCSFKHWGTGQFLHEHKICLYYSN